MKQLMFAVLLLALTFVTVNSQCQTALFCNPDKPEKTRPPRWWGTLMERARAKAKEESTGSQKFCDCCCGATPCNTVCNEPNSCPMQQCYASVLGKMLATVDNWVT